MKTEKYHDYKVSWEIEVSARSTREAAERALEIQRSPTSVATVFNVMPVNGKDTGKTETIDLTDDVDWKMEDNMEQTNYKIVRGKDAGVFAGTIGNSSRRFPRRNSRSSELWSISTTHP